MKTNATIRIIIWSIALVVLLGILVFGFALRYYAIDFTISESPEQSMAAVPITQPEEESALTLAQPEDKIIISADEVRDIEIEWVAGSILIQPADVEEIQICESDVSDVKDAMVYGLKNGKLSIDFCSNLDSFMGITINSNTLTKDLVIFVPRNWECDTLEIDAASAALEVNDLSIQEVEIDTASGACKFDNCTVNQLDLDTASGDIKFVGSLNILDCDAASASVYAVLSNIPTRMDMDSMSGDLDITLPADAGFTASIDALSSDFSSDFETTIKNGNHVCGDGSCRISISAMSGDVIIRKASDVSTAPAA